MGRPVLARRGGVAGNRRRNASGVPLPGNTVSGWTLTLANDFETPFSTGAVSSTGVFPAPYATEFVGYEDDWPDTSGVGNGSNSIYRPSQVLSCSNSKLIKHLFVNSTDRSGFAQSAAFIVEPGGVFGQQWGRFSACFRVPTSFNGWSTAWLMWPVSEVWPGDGEIDFPEGGIPYTMQLNMHRQDGVSGSDQSSVDTGVPFVSTGLGDGWHVVTLEWASNYCRAIIDNVNVGTFYQRVPNTPMRWTIQTETSGGDYPTYYPISSDQGILEIDWLAVWTYNGATIPGTTVPSHTSIFTEAFTGTNGAAWDTGRWSLTQTTTGGSTAIQTNRGRLTTGAVGGYNDAIVRKANVTVPVDFVAEGTCRFTTLSECFPAVFFRDADGTSANCYSIDFFPATGIVQLIKWVGFGQTALYEAPWTYSLDLEVSWEIYCAGSDLQVRLWNTSGGTRPTGPTLSYWDTTHVGTNLSLGLVGGSAAASRTAEFDAITISSVP